MELGETTKLIFEQVRQNEPVRVVFDSLSEMRLLAQNSLRYRRQILALKHFFAGRKCTVLRSVAIFDAVRSPTALAETVRTITSIPDVDAKIQALFPDGRGPRYSRPDPEQLAALGRVVLESVPLAILGLPQKTKALTVAMYSASALCVLFAVGLLVVSLRPHTAAALDDITRSRLFHPALLVLFGVSFLALTALFAAQSASAGRDPGYDFTAIPRALGTLTLVNLCLVFLIFLCSLLTRISDRLGIPLISPLIAVCGSHLFARLERQPCGAHRRELQHRFGYEKIGGKDAIVKPMTPNPSWPGLTLSEWTFLALKDVF